VAVFHSSPVFRVTHLNLIYGMHFYSEGRTNGSPFFGIGETFFALPALREIGTVKRRIGWKDKLNKRIIYSLWPEDLPAGHHF